MSASVTQKVVLWTLLSVWPSVAAAFVVVVKNGSDSAVIPCIQQANGDLEVLDPAAAVPSKGERVYDNATPWLRSGLLAATEGDTRTVSLIFLKTHQSVSCGKVLLEGGIVLEAIQNAGAPSCRPTSITPQLHETGIYTHYAVVDPSAFTDHLDGWSGWVIAPIDDSAERRDGDGAPTMNRYYATGPGNVFWDGTHPRASTITVQVCNNQSGEIKELHFSATRETGCWRYLMNDAAGCSDRKYLPRLHMEYIGPATDPSRPLPVGQYSGIVKIREVQYGTEKEIHDEFYLIVELTSSPP